MLTKEQKKAVDIENHTNVLVSAGAGSGKTSVLSKRVLRKVSDGFTVKRLLLLTFTKDAAKEMKDRVKSTLIENNYLEEASLVDEAYITTFDSFSLSLLKKYHYALNLPKNIEITDSILLDIIKRDALQKALDIEYENDNQDFEHLITNMSLKDDSMFIKNVLNISRKLDLMYDRSSFLDSYIDKFYDESYLNKFKDDYVNNVLKLFDKYKIKCTLLSDTLSEKQLDSFNSSFGSISSVKSYDNINDFFNNLKFSSRGFSDDSKEIYSDMKNIKDEITYFTNSYPKKEYIISDILKTKDDSICLVRILKNMYKFYDDVKEKNRYYDFSDISIMVINLLRDNDGIRNEVISSFDEIMVDEYQDTSDIEEELLKLISNNNLYMVGDIKQSIYRFRNANPNIFREKYRAYSNNNGGVKIDLNKNFRSREEVLQNINLMFNYIMDEEIGGANYREDSQAIFGNTTYNDYKGTNYNLDILTYDVDKTKKYSNTEQEIFIIAEDINKKIKSGVKVFDKNTNSFRPIMYSDFVILLSKKKNFDLYKKIFEYLNIPITIYREENVNNTDIIYVIHNLYKLVYDLSKSFFDDTSKKAFLSISRSFLFNLSDEEIFVMFKDNSFKNSTLYNMADSIKDDFNYLSPKAFFLKLSDTFSFDDKILTTSGIDEKEKSIYYIFDVISSLEDKGYNNLDVLNYLDEVIENNYKMSYDKDSADIDSVKIMSIHKSKGLEFPVCYFASLSDASNNDDAKEKIAFSKSYGFMIPVFNYGYKNLPTRLLYNRSEKTDDISEKIRLFYVALTRSREKIVLVMPNSDVNSECYDLVPNGIRLSYNSFYSMVKSIAFALQDYVIQVKPNLSKDYIISEHSVSLNKSNYKLDVREINPNSDTFSSKHFSKENINIISKDNKHLLEEGTLIHKVLEEIDFNNPNYELFNISDFIKDKIDKFINSDIIKKINNGKFYKEYEFSYEEDDNSYHGIIDFMVETSDSIYIFDYKLKGIDDPNYDVQLNGYRKYIESKTDKSVYTYLYSLLDSRFKKVV